MSNQTTDADTCSLECWAETATTPKQRKLRPGSKKQKNKPASKPNLGLVVVSAVREAARVPSDLGRNRLDADTCSLECWAETATTPKQRKLRPCDKKNEPASKPMPWACLCLCQPRTPSDLGRNSLDADTTPKQFGLASPPGVPPHNFPRGPHNVSRDLLSIGANNRRVRHHTDKKDRPDA